MDFAGWFEAYVGGSWPTFDPRNNAPRNGRVLTAYGRDAADVAISNAFGAAVQTHFKVHCDQAGPSHDPADAEPARKCTDRMRRVATSPFESNGELRRAERSWRNVLRLVKALRSPPAAALEKVECPLWVNPRPSHVATRLPTAFGHFDTFDIAVWFVDNPLGVQPPASQLPQLANNRMAQE